MLEIVGTCPVVSWECYVKNDTPIFLLILDSGAEEDHVAITIGGYTRLPEIDEGHFEYCVIDCVDAHYLMGLLLRKLGVKYLPLPVFR